MAFIHSGSDDIMADTKLKHGLCYLFTVFYLFFKHSKFCESIRVKSRPLKYLYFFMHSQLRLLDEQAFLHDLDNLVQHLTRISNRLGKIPNIIYFFQTSNHSDFHGMTIVSVTKTHLFV